MVLKINVGMSKVLVVKKDRFENVRVIGGEMEEVDRFYYLGVMISIDGIMRKLAIRMIEGR